MTTKRQVRTGDGSLGRMHIPGSWRGRVVVWRRFDPSRTKRGLRRGTANWPRARKQRRFDSAGSRLHEFVVQRPAPEAKAVGRARGRCPMTGGRASAYPDSVVWERSKSSHEARRSPVLGAGNDRDHCRAAKRAENAPDPRARERITRAYAPASAGGISYEKRFGVAPGRPDGQSTCTDRRWFAATP